MKHTSVTPFAMTRQVAELLWGQILKDAEFFDQQDAVQFVTLLGELGYDFNGDDFMSDKADRLIATADEHEVDHQVNFQYHPLGRTDMQTLADYRILAARLEKAAVAQSWRGSQPIEERESTGANLVKARRDLERFVDSLLAQEKSQ